MIKSAHITAQQLAAMVGNQLAGELWLKQMFNEIRRYPNEIPCEQGEIPSMITPFCSGEEKVEWCFTAGFSCLIPTESGAIRVRRSGHFPACACLALLTLLHEAGAAKGKDVDVELIIPEDAETAAFRDLLAKVQKCLRSVTIRITNCEPEEAPANESERFVISSSDSIAIVQKLDQLDLARFFSVVKGTNGSFSPGDAVTIVDGESLRALQCHCPVLQVVDMKTQKEVPCSDAIAGDIFGLYYAMWFPAGTALSSMTIVKETNQPAFTPETMPERPCLKKSFLQKLKDLFTF